MNAKIFKYFNEKVCGHTVWNESPSMTLLNGLKMIFHEWFKKEYQWILFRAKSKICTLDTYFISLCSLLKRNIPIDCIIDICTLLYRIQVVPCAIYSMEQRKSKTFFTKEFEFWIYFLNIISCLIEYHMNEWMNCMMNNERIWILFYENYKKKLKVNKILLFSRRCIREGKIMHSLKCYMHIVINLLLLLL